MLPTKNRQELAVFATIGLEEEIAKGIRIPLGSGFAGKIAASGEQMIVEDLSKIEVVSPILCNSGIHSMLGVPILLKEQVNGVLHVGTFRFRQFTHEDLQQIQFVAAQISLVMQIILKYPKVTSPNKAHFGLNAILNGSFVSALMY
ncbi:GAF domain-containing protein [Iningainema tapete]|uniref:GAF domain-containing protein n=1 Tax=Iningainema tapete TaxID=2806730 RepID=UPI00192D8FBF|nr:GAF domain-containing protein [Iningainema tapete]